MVRKLRREPNLIQENLELIIKATQQIAIRAEILEHENKHLHQALIFEKSRNKKKKGLGLLDGDTPGQAQFFSPAKIASKREEIREAEAIKEREKVLR